MESPYKFPTESSVIPVQPWSPRQGSGHRWGLLCWMVLSLSCMLGCSDGLPTVSGTVRLDGKPVAAAGVVLHPVKGGPVASGTTDAEGRYRLEAAGKPGVPPGEYRVTVVKVRTLGVITDKDGLSGVSNRGIKVKRLLPETYSDPHTTPLKATVSPSGDSYDFDLVSQPAVQTE